MSESTVKACLISAIFLGLLLDIVALRCREKARWIIYFEVFYMFLQGFVPYNFGGVARATQMFTLIIVFMAYSCDFLLNSLSIMVLFLVLRSMHHPLIYDLEITLGHISTAVLEGFLTFLICTHLGMNFTYIAKMKATISNLTEENLKLLNQMYEGLIVVSEDDRTL